jgi:hypothetical protein
MQEEITKPDRLLDVHGNLKQTGYARRPLSGFNPEHLKARSFYALNRMRLKEWDYYGVTTRDFFFSACVSNLGYMGLVFVYWIDFGQKKIWDSFRVTPFGIGCRMPLTTECGDIRFKQGAVQMDFIRRRQSRELIVNWPRMTKGRDLRAELSVSQPTDHEGITMATPIDKKGFYYNQKINAMPTTGTLIFGDQHETLEGNQGLACLDWGRGVWPYKTFWIWANASGVLKNGKLIGINLGKGFGDLRAATENCFFIDGEMHKLGWVDIQYDPKNYLDTWRFISDDDRCDLTFTPFFRRRADTNLLVMRSDANQIFGHYNGTLIQDDGTEVKVENLTGWAEDHNARW